jgi:hypothetical protein
MSNQRKSVAKALKKIDETIKNNFENKQEEFIYKVKQLNGVYIEYDNYYYDIRKEEDIKRLSNRKNIKESLETCNKIQINNQRTIMKLLDTHQYREKEVLVDKAIIRVGKKDFIENYFNILYYDDKEILVHRRRNKYKYHYKYKEILKVINDIGLLDAMLDHYWDYMYKKNKDYVTYLDNNYKEFEKMIFKYMIDKITDIYSYGYIGELISFFEKRINKDYIEDFKYDFYKSLIKLNEIDSSSEIKKFLSKIKKSDEERKCLTAVKLS